MIQRRLSNKLLQRLKQSPAVVLLGPRQVGKTTLSLDISGGMNAIYLDPESEIDRAKLIEPEAYLSEHADKLVILDEIHRLPNLFQPLRVLIDAGRRRGRKTGQFLLLGSASIDILKQSGESLAGRVSYLELSPFDSLEISANSIDTLWLRGGFPESFLAEDDQISLRWRRDFVISYLEREIPMLGPRIPAETLRRFWTMLAHYQCSLFNAAQLARSLGIDGKTVAGYLDLLVDLLLVRRLPAWHHNLGKRLVRSPKVFIRDSGILHALLGLKDRESLLGHPIVGQSWEGFAIETLLTVAPEGVEASFYRSSGGAEVDLVLRMPNADLWCIEIKRSMAPKVERGFYSACEDLKPSRKFVVYPGRESYEMNNSIQVISLRRLAELLLEYEF